MAHTYVVTTDTYVPGSSPDPVVTITGSVDGEPVTITTYLSVLQQAFSTGGLSAVKNAVAPLMLAQAQSQISARTPTQITQLPTGTFVQ